MTHRVVTMPSVARPGLVLFKQVCSCGHVVEGTRDVVLVQRAGHIAPGCAGR